MASSILAITVCSSVIFRCNIECIQMKKKNITSIVATIISVVLLVVGTVGLILLQKPLQEENLDIRQQASVDNGQVTVSSSPASGSTTEVSQETTIDFQADTSGVQTDGVQLVFNIITNTISENPVISVPSSSGLQSISTQVQSTSDGYLISIVAVPQQAGGTFSSSSPTTIAQLKINPTTIGNIEISFDREKSKSIIHTSGTDTAEDILTHISALDFTVIDTISASPSPTPSPTPSPSPTPGTGGVTVQGCNDSCSSNAECETNHRCYSGQCRLVTNVSSTTCTNQTDQGLSFGCNEYCADSNECDDSYTCLENKCRRSDNPDNSSCQIPSSAIQESITASCNVTCSANKDCAANLRCYYGECRLATNVSSTTCAAATAKTVSNLYVKPAAVPTTPKGGDLEDDELDATDSTIPAAIISKPSPSPSPTSYVKPPLKDESALDAIVSSLQEAGVPVSLLPIIALGIGGLLLLLIVIPKIFGRKNKSNKVNGAAREGALGHKHEQQLQTKINDLKKQPPVAPTTMARPQVTTPVAQPITPITPAAPDPRPQPTPPQSPMMDRVKEKGINPPKI